MRTVQKRECNHTLHLILTLVSCGMWAPVWIVAAAMGRRTVTYGVYPPQPLAYSQAQYQQPQLPVSHGFGQPDPARWYWDAHTQRWTPR